MDKYIAQGAGFPADNDFLMFIQSIIGEVSQLGGIGGTNYILKGCTVTGGNVSDGWMVIDGEVVRFSGGAIGTQVTIIEDVTNATYLEDINPADGQGDSKPAYFVRTAQFGNSGSSTINWASLERLKPLVEIQKAITPVDGIIMFAGSIANIPDQWYLCDGTNNTVDLRGMFIVGYDPDDFDYNTIGKQGGSKDVTLNVNQMPAHKHSGTTTNAGAHTHGIPNNTTKTAEDVDTTSGEWGGNVNRNQTIQTDSNGTHAHSLNINNEGGGASHPNRPPYFTLAYIQYKGV
ncbi:Microcystin-dependent protein [Maribacter dokdonensis]|uniref:phage baseplate protein n=1 Tax=Maribacter dokdonensis TaxID=320912 RepID=UPI001B1F491B|nr:hypothetical protein [Maribacter dokdonensis]CAG2532913.1 Microcystin-dependent protein [Maribacter dokdonensis]